MKNEETIACYYKNKETGFSESIMFYNNTGLLYSSSAVFRFKKILHSLFFILHSSFQKILFLILFFFPTFLLQAQNNNIDGKASYYSNKLHGRRMSSGKVYHRDSLTCAHKTLPFGTKLKVTNPSNGKEVIVEVADRGPYSHSRVIDLSYAAARELGIIAHGIKYVKIEILPEDYDKANPTTGNLFSMLDAEYGMAGVCYEFIPEWSDEEKVSQKSKDNTGPSGNAVRRGNGQGHKAANTVRTATDGNTAKQHIRHKQQKQTQGHGRQGDTQKQPQKKEPVKKEQSSSSWTEFFDKLKNWGGSLFE